ncbi:MAG TPA: FAD-dependent oxidoreductase [Bryobacteraceae bacterium]|nr:FAD-dependent oxidoreductase [Bryobacteraceae bacterium]
MADREFDVVVVGAGPAGLTAACRVAECGKQVAMLDDNPLPGGQIWRGASKEAAAWMHRARRLGVEWLAGARVFDAPELQKLAVETLEGEFRIAYGSLILATGARERFLPFPGWTLPNVMGAGGLQALAKSGLAVAGKRVVVAGSGPLLLAVARYMKSHGADVRLIAEQASQSSVMRFALSCPPGKLMQAIGLRAGLIGIPYRTGCWPVSAQGKDRLESVTLQCGHRTWSEPCDYLACGFGLIPNLELAALLGCRVSQSGVEVDERQQTSVRGVYAAGEATGIGGLELSLSEGEIAGYAASGNSDRAKDLFGARAAHRRFAKALEDAFALRAELRDLPRPETFVCRCEDVNYERVRGCSNWREAKLHTRCGMGPCQGRICGGAVEFLLGWKAESVRPPVLPARVGSMSR